MNPRTAFKGTITLERNDYAEQRCPLFITHITDELFEHADPALIVRDGPFVYVAGVGYLELVGRCPDMEKVWHAETRTPPKPQLNTEANR